jgi:hypothetical protein
MMRMKRTIVVLLALSLTIPVPLGAATDERALKRQLLGELLDVIDAKALTQASFDLVFNKLGEMSGATPEGLDDASKAEWEEAHKKQAEEMRAFKERLFHRIDYAKYAEEIYYPLFDKQFTADELKELIAFYKTKPGQKTVKMLPELAVGGLMEGAQLLQEEAQKIADEMKNEEEQKHPWKKTMGDLRTMATALEAYATDTNEYVKGSSMKELQPLLQPTYVRTLPMTDAWGTEYSYVGDGTHYRFASAGADKHFEWRAKQLETMPEGAEPSFVDDDDADLIYQDGNFVQAPKQAKQEQ